MQNGSRKAQKTGSDLDNTHPSSRQTKQQTQQQRNYNRLQIMNRKVLRDRITDKLKQENFLEPKTLQGEERDVDRINKSIDELEMHCHHLVKTQLSAVLKEFL